MSVLEVRGLDVRYPRRDGLGRVRGFVHAVRGVDLDLRPGETAGLVGESGCGKSTIARAVLRLVPIHGGRVSILGRDWTALPERRLRPLRPDAQMIFQDPFSSLNPRMRIGEALAEPLRVHRRGDARARAERVAELLTQVGLHPDDARKYPHEFSGGQRQRIGIARAVILEPKLLIADEAVSALDVSIQAQVLNLLSDLQRERGFAMLFISHDLRIVERICDTVHVMYLGRIVESGSPDTMFSVPRHPYTEALLSAVPRVDPEARRARIVLAGEPPDPVAPPPGCAFAPRCRRAAEVCRSALPELDQAAPGRSRVACRFPLDGTAV